MSDEDQTHPTEAIVEEIEDRQDPDSMIAEDVEDDLELDYSTVNKSADAIGFYDDFEQFDTDDEHTSYYGEDDE